MTTGRTLRLRAISGSALASCAQHLYRMRPRGCSPGRGSTGPAPWVALEVLGPGRWARPPSTLPTGVCFKHKNKTVSWW